MTNQIITLIKDLIESTGQTLNNFLKDLYYFVFYFEEQLKTSSSDYIIDFDKIYKTIYVWSLIFIAIVFIKKLIQSYFLFKSGEEDQNPLKYVVSLFEAIIISIGFGWTYTYLINLGFEFYNSVLDAGGLTTLNMTKLVQNVGDGIFQAIIILIIIGQILGIIWSFIKRGLQILIMRCVIPLTTIGLLSSNGGAFSVVMKKFTQNFFAVVLQLILLSISLKLIEAQRYIFAVATLMLTNSGVEMLQDFIVSIGGAGLTTLASKGMSTARGGLNIVNQAKGGMEGVQRGITGIGNIVQGAKGVYNLSSNNGFTDDKSTYGNSSLNGSPFKATAGFIAGSILKSAFTTQNSSSRLNSVNKALNNVHQPFNETKSQANPNNPPQE